MRQVGGAGQYPVPPLLLVPVPCSRLCPRVTGFGCVRVRVCTRLGTGIMGVFFNEKIMITAVCVIAFLLLAICCFAKYGDCALT